MTHRELIVSLQAAVIRHMNTHAEILQLLEKYQGGKFVPKDGRGDTLVFRRRGFYWGRGEDYCQAADARAHIELAGIEAAAECMYFMIVHVGSYAFVTNVTNAAHWSSTRAGAILAILKRILGEQP